MLELEHFVEHIKQAVRLAKASKKADPGKNDKTERVDVRARSVALTPSGNGRWKLPNVDLDTAHLERHRIVSHEARDPSHIAFNVLRTKVFQVLGLNSWKSLAISSPTRDCGKSMVAVNLAFSLARQQNCKTVLIDLDLKKSSVATALGVTSQKSIGQFLEGKAALQECFVQVTENLFFGLNSHESNQTFELAQHKVLSEIIPKVIEALNPTVVIVDLPPMLGNDDVIAFLPMVDAGVLVAAAGKTTVEQIEECQSEFNGGAKFLGVVLNKSREQAEDYYQYYKP